MVQNPRAKKALTALVKKRKHATTKASSARHARLETIFDFVCDLLNARLAHNCFRQHVLAEAFSDQSILLFVRELSLPAFSCRLLTVGFTLRSLIHMLAREVKEVPVFDVGLVFARKSRLNMRHAIIARLTCCVVTSQIYLGALLENV